MKRRRFIVDFSDYNKEDFLAAAEKTNAGIPDNPDFRDAPVTAADFRTAYNLMVAAAPAAIRKNIDGQRIFKPLRVAVEDMMTRLAEYAQPLIGNNPERMTASGLPLSKEPTERPENINVAVAGPKVELGETSGKINVSAKSYRAADGILIEERQVDKTYKEIKRAIGFKATINGYHPDDVVVLQIRYWNNEGEGPRLGRPLAIVV